jgi:hypothetical protein
MQASIAFWWRWPALMAGAMPARDPAEKDGQARDKAAAARVVAAEVEAMRNLAESINGTAPARAPAPLKPARRSAKAKPQSKRRHKR